MFKILGLFGGGVLRKKGRLVMIFNLSRKWKIFATYNFGEKDYIIFATKGKNGILHFKTKCVTQSFSCTHLFNGKEYDANKQLREILEEEEK